MDKSDDYSDSDDQCPAMFVGRSELSSAAAAFFLHIIIGVVCQVRGKTFTQASSTTS